MGSFPDEGRMRYGYVYLDWNGNETNRPNALIRVSFAEVVADGVTTPHMHKMVELPEMYKGESLIKEPVAFVSNSGRIELTPDDLVLQGAPRKRFYSPHTNGLYVGGSNIDEMRFEDLRGRETVYGMETDPIHCDCRLGEPYRFLSVMLLDSKFGLNDRHEMTYLPENARISIGAQASSLGHLQNTATNSV